VVTVDVKSTSEVDVVYEVTMLVVVMVVYDESISFVTDEYTLEEWKTLKRRREKGLAREDLRSKLY
jgi:hypothetical protein